MKTKVENKKIEIFCGTGGVGKTTLATSRALYLACNNKKVLIITIDPSKRLKQILGISDDDMGKIKQINAKSFGTKHKNKDYFFDALLMAPMETLKFIGRTNKTSANYKNPILQVLMRPYGGLNEIMSIVELNRYFKQNKYDTIIVDTPPGKNFIDFLDASKKIHNFFDKNFIEIFKYIGSPQAKRKTGFFSSLVSGGVKKLLSYLEKVTGETFVKHFIDAVVSIYKGKDTFLESLQIQEILQKPELTNWFLVTSIEQQKIDDAMILKEQSTSYMQTNSFLAINKSLLPFLEKWEAPKSNTNLSTLRKIMIEKELMFKNLGTKGFQDTLVFPEVIHNSPAKHVHELYQAWTQ